MTQTGVPAALNALKEWSAWLVSIQAAVIALAGYAVGKESLLPVKDSPWVRRLLIAAIVALAASIFFATWVLGAIPSILLRMQESPGNTDFYHMPIAGAPAFEAVYQWLPDNAQYLLQLWAFAAAEHLLFLMGILCVVLAILVAVMRR